MQAAIVESFGEPGRIVVRERPDPVAGPGQVLVRAQAMGVGYVDLMAAQGRYPYFPSPGVAPGLEVAGVVEACGTGVDTELLGRRVLGLPAFGGLAEWVVVDADRVFPLDGDVTEAEAVALGVNALVAEIGLERAGVAGGERVLVRGAGGGIGVLATQIAAARGAHVTAVTSSATRAQRLAELGAARVIRRDEASFFESPFDIVVDPVGGSELAAHLRLLAPNGRFLLCGAAGGVPASADLETIMEIYHSSPTLLAFSLNSVSAPDLRASWHRIVGLARNGRVRSVIGAQYSLAAAPEALHAVEQGGTFGKVVLQP